MEEEHKLILEGQEIQEYYRLINEFDNSVMKKVKELSEDSFKDKKWSIAFASFMFAAIATLIILWLNNLMC